MWHTRNELTPQFTQSIFMYILFLANLENSSLISKIALLHNSSQQIIFYALLWLYYPRNVDVDSDIVITVIVLLLIKA